MPLPKGPGQVRHRSSKSRFRPCPIPKVGPGHASLIHADRGASALNAFLALNQQTGAVYGSQIGKVKPMIIRFDQSSDRFRLAFLRDQRPPSEVAAWAR